MKVKDKIQDAIEKAIANSYSYIAYRKLVTDLVQKNKSTGPIQNESLSQYSKLNDARMRRLDKTLKVPEATLEAILNVNEPMIWLVITESWCGDASQSMPMLNKIAELNPLVSFKVVLRDDNKDLMQQFLTNGGESIPKLIAFKPETLEVLWDWGPRPSEATKMVADFKAENGTLTAPFKQKLQVWYNKDKGYNIAEDIEQFLR